MSSTTITVRDMDPKDKYWIKREARQVGVSMEEFVRRLIRGEREKAEHCTIPSEAFKHYFGPDHGVELPPPERYGYRPVDLTDASEA